MDSARGRRRAAARRPPVLAAGATGEDLGSAASPRAPGGVRRFWGRETRPSAEGGGRGVRRRVCWTCSRSRRTPCLSRRWCWSPADAPMGVPPRERPPTQERGARKEKPKSSGAAARADGDPAGAGGDVAQIVRRRSQPTPRSSRSYGCERDREGSERRRDSASPPSAFFRARRRLTAAAAMAPRCSRRREPRRKRHSLARRTRHHQDPKPRSRRWTTSTSTVVAAIRASPRRSERGAANRLRCAFATPISTAARVICRVRSARRGLVEMIAVITTPRARDGERRAGSLSLSARRRRVPGGLGFLTRARRSPARSPRRRSTTSRRRPPPTRRAPYAAAAPSGDDRLLGPCHPREEKRARSGEAKRARTPSGACRDGAGSRASRRRARGGAKTARRRGGRQKARTRDRPGARRSPPRLPRQVAGGRRPPVARRCAATPRRRSPRRRGALGWQPPGTTAAVRARARRRRAAASAAADP